MKNYIEIIKIDEFGDDEYVIWFKSPYSTFISHAFVHLAKKPDMGLKLVDVNVLLNDEADWSVTNSKKDLISLENTEWKHSIVGKVISVNPVIVECGVLLELPIYGDSIKEMIDKNIKINIDRIDIYEVVDI